MQAVSVQVMEVPVHTPALHVSPYVQRFPSEQTVDRRHCHVPPALVQKYVDDPQDTTSQALVTLHT
jgi:hypothetical protein